MQSRHEIFLENYCKLIGIEANTMVDMALKDILPAVSAYSHELCLAMLAKKQVCEQIDVSYEKGTMKKISALSAEAYKQVVALQSALEKVKGITCAVSCAACYQGEILPTMRKLRAAADELEGLVSAKYWPFPTYGDLLFSV